MQDSFRRRASALARRVGLHGPLRALYNVITLSHATRTVALGPLQRVFATPTHTIREHVEALGGEHALLEAFLRELRSEDVVWDIGASFGLYSLFVAGAITSPGAVVAFEPETRMRSLLQKNLALNHITGVSIQPIALGDRDGWGTLFQSASANTGTSALAQRTDYRLNKRGITVAVRRGDALVEGGQVPRPTVLKIDVEGAEGRVLAGFDTTLHGPTLRLIYCEVHPQLLPSFGDTTASVEAAVAGAGFTIGDRIARGSEYHLVCRR